MQLSIYSRVALGLAIGLATSAALSEPVRFDRLVTDIKVHFEHIPEGELILGAAKNLFMALATISLVWTMGLQVVRQDLGEAMMELLRFMIATGTLYWLLINASDPVAGEGFVQRIVGSFYQMSNDSDSEKSFLSYGNGAVNRAQDIYLKVIGDTSVGDNSDRIVVGLIGLIVLIVLTLLAAQFLLALIMAWFLGYGGIFLLGFGGSRWTSQIAINYYKHVVALGIAILALSFIGLVSANVFAGVVPTYGKRGLMTYAELGRILAVSVMMLVLGLRVPQLLYTLVTGSSLGMFAGMAGMVGSAIATGGGAALASAGGRFLGGTDGGSDGGASASVARANSAMEAVERSAASVGAMSDPFHVSSGSDPFGVRRDSDALRGASRGSVFSTGGSQVAGGGSSTSGVKTGGEHSPATSMASGSTVQARDVGLPGGAVGRSVNPAPAGSDRGAGASDADMTKALKVGEGEGVQQPDYSAEMSAIAAARSDDLMQVSGAAEDQAVVIHASHGVSPGLGGGVDVHTVDETATATATAPAPAPAQQDEVALGRHDDESLQDDRAVAHIQTADAIDPAASATPAQTLLSHTPADGLHESPMHVTQVSSEPSELMVSGSRIDTQVNVGAAPEPDRLIMEPPSPLPSTVDHEMADRPTRATKHMTAERDGPNARTEGLPSHTIDASLPDDRDGDTDEEVAP